MPRLSAASRQPARARNTASRKVHGATGTRVCHRQRQQDYRQPVRFSAAPSTAPENSGLSRHGRRKAAAPAEWRRPVRLMRDHKADLYGISPHVGNFFAHTKSTIRAVWPDGRSGGCSLSVRVHGSAFITRQGGRPAPITAIGRSATRSHRGGGPPVHASMRGKLLSGLGSISFDHECAPYIDSRYHRRWPGAAGVASPARASDLTASAGGTRSAAGPGRPSSRRRRRRARN